MIYQSKNHLFGMGDPVGNNHCNSCKTTWLGRGESLVPALFIHFEDGDPIMVE